MKKKVHIISHTHWDREWYLPYEKHHMLLIELMDLLIKTLDNDPEYKSFHLDGHTLPIEDYLEVRPEKKEKLIQLIRDERIVIGPWFILQDEFLTSSEANIRNIQIGHSLAKKYGDRVSKLGYFPDSFGNMGQAPQILKKCNIDTAVFGRGVKPTGFNNQVSDDYESPYSEMYWQSEDGSRVLAILFANWYCNGMEVPVNKEEAKVYWDKRIKDADRYASTDHLLFMNGCDHQPIQVDLSNAIEVAKEIYPDIEFIHSNFKDYVENIKTKLPKDLTVITGELRSQKTDGFYTLANTASSRIYLKQMNTYCQMLFENIAEPIATICFKEGMEYPHHLFTYGWKTLMENHPHDSICGCSVDEVHGEMVTRFQKAKNIAFHIIDECSDYLVQKIDTSIFCDFGKDAKPFIVFNTSGYDRGDVIETELEIEKIYFSEKSIEEITNECKANFLPKFKIINRLGEEISGTVEEIPYAFNYDLPKDRFRQPYFAKKVKVIMEARDIPAYGWETFALVESKDEKKKEFVSLVKDKNTIETDNLIVDFAIDGSMTINDKVNGCKFSNLGIFEDCGDIGNEYIFFQPINDRPITTKGKKAKIEIIEDTEIRAIVKVTHTMLIPSKADDLLEKEMQDLIEFKKRKSSRGNNLIPMEIETFYTFNRKSRGIKVKTKFNNQALNHRLRVLFETNLDTDFHYVDSIFEVAKRNTIPSKEWENPSNAQHQQAFVNVCIDNCGLTIANRGLNEYEILSDNTIALTIHRGVGELGDWGVFYTPEAQCLGNREVEYEIITHGKGDDIFASFEEAYKYQIDWVVKGTSLKGGELLSDYCLFKSNHLAVVPSALKVSEKNEIISRWYNINREDELLRFDNDINLFEIDLLEEEIIKELKNEISVGKKEILTIGMRL